MDGMRKPDVRRLLRVYQPRSFLSRLDVGVYQGCFRLARAHLLGMAAGASLHRRNSGKRAVIAKRMALAAFRHPRFLRMRLVPELERLWLLHVEHARKRDPPGQQRYR